jgi:hypothetical protein
MNKLFKSGLLLMSLLYVTPAVTLAQRNKAKVASQLLWSADRKLTWNDFQGQVPKNERLAAMTSSDISVQFSCNDGVFKPNVTATFLPSGSWKQSDAPSERLLAHEQLHFDITELHSRKLKAVLHSTPNPCNLSQDQLNAIVNRVFADWQKMEDQYDKDSNHGLDETRQLFWSEFVKKALSEFPAAP